MSIFSVSGIKDVIKSLGVVFGDIGTSPLYTLNALVIFVAPTQANIFGLISLIVWTLVILVFIEYALLAMSLGRRGEGGTIVLRELLIPLLRSRKQIAIVTFLSFVGISLFIGDGVITPAVSILSAIEGIQLVKVFQFLPQVVFVALACVIAIVLFFFQSRGTDKVAATFGPLMFIWFVTLAITGLFAIVQFPSIVQALNPWCGISFMIEHGILSFFVLSSVILCATGGEALYADMGHLGRKPILRAWYFVFVALVLSYLGQGAYLITHPNTSLVLHEMVLSQTTLLYIPFIILGIIATVIASQALISGVYSVVYQGIMTGIFPRLKVDYTSSRLRSQVYIGSVNWMLLLAVLFMIINFGSSVRLTFAYGLAVTGTMTLTGIMMTWIFYRRRSSFKMVLSSLITLIDLVFFCSSLGKLPYGGYWSIIIAMIPFGLIVIYTSGKRRLRSARTPVPIKDFLEQYQQFTATSAKLRGSALFFMSDFRRVPSYVAQTMFKNNIVYEDNIFVSVITRDNPFGVTGFFKESLAPGIRVFEIHQGYMEVLDIGQVLKSAEIDAQVIFYGLDEIVTKNILWRAYAIIERLTPTFVQFYKLPPQKLHGVVTLVEM